MLKWSPPDKTSSAGNACIWQSRQIRRAERERGASRPKGEQPDSASQSPRPLRGGGGRETRSINSPTSAGAFPAGQWRGTIMTGFRIKRCAHLQRRRCDERGEEEDEMRGSRLDWRLEIVEGQRGLWSVTRATAMTRKITKKKKKKIHESSRAWSECEGFASSVFFFGLFYPDFFLLLLLRAPKRCQSPTLS